MTIFNDGDDDDLILMVFMSTLLVTSTLVFSTKKRTLFKSAFTKRADDYNNK